jgi:hypothetical protein
MTQRIGDCGTRLVVFATVTPSGKNRIRAILRRFGVSERAIRTGSFECAATGVPRPAALAAPRRASI